MQKPERCSGLPLPKYAARIAARLHIWTAAPAPPRLFLPQAAARLRSQTQLPVSSAGRGRCVCLLRLADFCFAPRRGLAKTGALLRVAVAQICGADRSPLAYLDGCPCSASPVSTAGSGSAPQPSTAPCFVRRTRSLCLPCRCPSRTHMSSGWDFFCCKKRPRPEAEALCKVNLRGGGDGRRCLPARRSSGACPSTSGCRPPRPGPKGNRGRCARRCPPSS